MNKFHATFESEEDDEETLEDVIQLVEKALEDEGFSHVRVWAGA